MRRLLLGGLTALGWVLLGCGGPSGSRFTSTHDAGADGEGGGATGGMDVSSPPPNFADAPWTGTSSLVCSAAAKLVYVIDDLGYLHSFDPNTLTFVTVGPTNCPGASGTNSMAIDRMATAWVNDVNGELYKVNTETAFCESTTFIAGQHSFANQLGMGFSANTDGGTGETLFVDGARGQGLATIDLASMTLTPVAPFSGVFSEEDCELTGTGDARLYGFFANNPASVAQIDKSTAAVLGNVPLAGVDTGTDWAFSFWGGSFYLYTANRDESPADTSNVTQYDPMTGISKTVLAEIGFRIVGAGVSTCAPVTAPIK